MKLPVKAETDKLLELIKNRIGGDTPAGRFFLSIKNRMGIGSPLPNETDTYERGMKIVPACISANENEIPVRQYNIAVLRNPLKFERAEGRMQLTNKRVIFRAAGRSAGGRTTLQQEFAIDEIAGIEARNNFKFSFLYLLFAILISALASLIIYQSPLSVRIQPPEFSLMNGYVSLPMIESNDSQSRRLSGIMFPKHIQKAYENERTAIYLRSQAEEKLHEVKEKLKNAMDAEEKAFGNVTRGLQKTRRVQTGTNWWGQAEYSTQTYRDTSPAGLKEAEDLLDSAIAEREKEEDNEQKAVMDLEVARENEIQAIQSRVNAVFLWKVFMTLCGTIIGAGGLLPFFIIKKRFGLKLFILNFSVFGFMVALTASELRIFFWLAVLSNIVAFICVFLYCFRPNVLISIKNKSGIAAALDIRRDTIFTKRQGKGTGFSEVIPTDETERAIREIGAMINDIQKRGDLGLQKWIT